MSRLYVQEVAPLQAIRGIYRFLPALVLILPQDIFLFITIGCENT